MVAKTPSYIDRDRTSGLLVVGVRVEVLGSGHPVIRVLIQLHTDG